MERYFFDVEDGGLTVDSEGRMLIGADAVAEAAMTTLLEAAKPKVVTNNEREVTVTVRNEAGDLVYRTLLTIKAGWVFDAR